MKPDGLSVPRPAQVSFQLLARWVWQHLQPRPPGGFFMWSMPFSPFLLSAHFPFGWRCHKRGRQLNNCLTPSTLIPRPLPPSRKALHTCGQRRSNDLRPATHEYAVPPLAHRFANRLHVKALSSMAVHASATPIGGGGHSGATGGNHPKLNGTEIIPSTTVLAPVHDTPRHFFPPPRAVLDPLPMGAAPSFPASPCGSDDLECEERGTAAVIG